MFNNLEYINKLLPIIKNKKGFHETNKLQYISGDLLSNKLLLSLNTFNKSFSSCNNSGKPTQLKNVENSCNRFGVIVYDILNLSIKFVILLNLEAWL